MSSSRRKHCCRRIGADKDEALSVLRERVYSAVDAAKARLADIEKQAGVVAQRASVAAEAYMRENPWTVIGGAAAAGPACSASLFTRVAALGLATSSLTDACDERARTTPRRAAASRCSISCCASRRRAWSC